ncbi:MAG: hypothetical protein AB1664_13215 [Thermodesulfobacteriota bacterium]
MSSFPRKARASLFGSTFRADAVLGGCRRLRSGIRRVSGGKLSITLGKAIATAVVVFAAGFKQVDKPLIAVLNI